MLTPPSAGGPSPRTRMLAFPPGEIATLFGMNIHTRTNSFPIRRPPSTSAYRGSSVPGADFVLLTAHLPACTGFIDRIVSPSLLPGDWMRRQLDKPLSKSSQKSTFAKAPVLHAGCGGV